MGEHLHLTNIRTARERPGLRAQHLKALQAAAQISRGLLQGGVIGSREITFAPGGPILGGDFTWDIGTAGSTTMLALTLLPLALFAQTPSRYRISGGLFQDFAPPAFHMKHVLLPILAGMGTSIDLSIIRPGYVPKGQGILEISVTPLKETLMPLNLNDRGRVTEIRGIALSSLLKDRQVSERMAGECRKALSAYGYDPRIDLIHDTTREPAYELPSVQAGAALAVWARTDTGCLIGADMAGSRGRPAEFIGKETAGMLTEDLASGATLDRHLADQIIPFAALAEGWSSFLIPTMTDHVETRLWLAREILGAETEVQGNLVRIKGIGYGRSALKCPK